MGLQHCQQVLMCSILDFISEYVPGIAKLLIGGASAIIAATVNPLPPWHGFSFVLVVLVASAGMMLIALIVNNMHQKKQYPTYWFGGKW